MMTRYHFARAVLTVVLAMVCAMPTALAQAKMNVGQQVEIGGVTLELGASRADTMAVARQRLMVMSSSTSGYYNLYRKPSSRRDDAVQSIAIGALWFRNDRLFSVTRNLGAFQSFDGRIAIDNLIAAVSAATQHNPAPVGTPRKRDDRPPQLPPLSATTEEKVTRNFSVSRVYFTFPDRVIQIAVFDPVDSTQKASVAISEDYALREMKDGDQR